MDIKNIMKNITPSITVMVVGLVGAYFVYNTYFSERVATGFAGYEPAAGEEMVIEAEHEADMVDETEEVMDEAEEAVDDMAEEEMEETSESFEEMTEEYEDMDEEAEEVIEEDEGAADADDMAEEAEEEMEDHGHDH